jgi:hypothetical protein
MDMVKNFAKFTHTLKSRRRQDDVMMGQWILNNVTPEYKNTLRTHEKQYRLEGGITSGLCLLKVLLQESYVENQALTSLIRRQLAKLDDKIMDLSYDIGKFVSYVTDLITKLHAQGETSSDLMTNLFSAFEKVTNSHCKSWLIHKKNAWEEGHGLTEKVDTPDALMEACKSKWNRLRMDGQWDILSTDEQIIALQATQKKQAQQLAKATGGRGRGRGGGRDSSGGRGRGSGRGRGPRKDSRKDLPEHLTKKPDDLNTTHQHKGKTWRWCCPETGGKCSGQWVVHKAQECKGVQRGPKRDTPPGGRGNQEKKVKLDQAVAAVADEDEDYQE